MNTTNLNNAPDNYIPISDGRTRVPKAALDHPRPYRLRKIAKEFRKVAKVESNELSFLASDVPVVSKNKNNSLSYTSCGAVACHGGWAASILIKLGFVPIAPFRAITGAPCYVKITYILGKIHLGEYLFTSAKVTKYPIHSTGIILYDNPHSNAFTSWASNYPNLWGSSKGAAMFASGGYEAFGFSPYIPPNITLNDIADWYDNVAYRIEQALYI